MAPIRKTVSKLPARKLLVFDRIRLIVRCVWSQFEWQPLDTRVNMTCSVGGSRAQRSLSFSSSRCFAMWPCNIASSVPEGLNTSLASLSGLLPGFLRAKISL